MMKISNWNAYFFLVLLLGVGTVTFFIFQPFLTAMLAAAIIAVLFARPYRWFLKTTGERRGLSAAITLLVVAIVIVVPVFVIITLTANELSRLYQEVATGAGFESSLREITGRIDEWPYLQLLMPGETINASPITEQITDNVRGLSQSLFSILQALYQSIAHFVFWVFAMFFALFYFLVDGEKAVRFLMRLSPLRDEHEVILIQEFISTSRAIIKGTLVIGLVQGFLGGVSFAIAGVDSPVIWGILMGFLSLIPIAGAGLIWFPAALILLLTGNIWQGFFLLAVGFGLISTIDNILRPKLVGNDTQIHPLLVLFATLGGLSFFGLVGFIVGPIVTALFITLVRIYGLEFKRQLAEYNK